MPRCQFDGRRDELTNNLLYLWRKERTLADTELGLAWYPNTHRIVCEWADTYGYSIRTVACVVAALSPQCPWERNLIVADDVLAGRPPSVNGVLRSCLAKAQAIRSDRASDITRYFPYGPKVNSFAANLAGDVTAVTVDGHAMQAALANVRATTTLPWTPYNVFADCYRQAAQTVDVAPCDFQAVIWHTWKRIYPTAVKRAKRQQWSVIGEL